MWVWRVLPLLLLGHILLASATGEGVGAWLSENGLSDYVQNFADAGYDDLQVLREMSKEDMHELVKFTKLKPGHALKIRKRLIQSAVDLSAADDIATTLQQQTIHIAELRTAVADFANRLKIDVPVLPSTGRPLPSEMPDVVPGAEAVDGDQHATEVADDSTFLSHPATAGPLPPRQQAGSGAAPPPSPVGETLSAADQLRALYAAHAPEKLANLSGPPGAVKRPSRFPM
jgi:hypothetical protein